MAFEGNPEHLAVLKRAIEAGDVGIWNVFKKRLAEKDEWADLTGANLRKYNLSEFDLSGANLIGADLIGADLTGADLTGADLEGADLEGADLKGADLKRADLKRADLKRADLKRTFFLNAKLSFAKLSFTDFSGADLSGADLSKTNLEGAKLINAKLLNAKLVKAYLFEADFTNANLAGGDFQGADFTGADFTGADFTGANLFAVDLTKTILSGATLSKINLSEFNLSNFNFQKTDLKETDLRLSNLMHTDLTGANLTGAKLFESQRTGWIIKDVTCERASWDEKGEIFEEYAPGEFERLFSAQTIEIEFPDGIEPYQYLSTPAIIAKLQEKFGDKCILDFSSLSKGPGNNTLTLNVTGLKEGENFEEVSQEVREDYKELDENIKQALLRRDPFILQKTKGMLLIDVKNLSETKERLEKIIDSQLEGINMESGDTYNVQGDLIRGDGNVKIDKSTGQRVMNIGGQPLSLDEWKTQVLELLPQAKEEIKALPEEQKEEAAKKLKTVELEVDSKSPDKGMLQAAKPVLQGVAGSLIASGITALPKLIELIGQFIGG